MLASHAVRTRQCGGAVGCAAAEPLSCPIEPILPSLTPVCATCCQDWRPPGHWLRGRWPVKRARFCERTHRKSVAIHRSKPGRVSTSTWWPAGAASRKDIEPPRKFNSASACQGLNPAPAAARCGYVLNPGKKQGRGAWVSEGRFPACQPAPARSYRERGSDPPSSH